MQRIPIKICKNFPPRYSEISIMSKPAKFFRSLTTNITKIRTSAKIYIQFKIEAFLELFNIICGKFKTR